MIGPARKESPDTSRTDWLQAYKLTWKLWRPLIMATVHCTSHYDYFPVRLMSTV